MRKMSRILGAVVALAVLAACGAPEDARPRAASGDSLLCNVTYNLLAGPMIIESAADIVFDLDIGPLGAHYTVRRLTVTKPWEGRGELDPWRIFLEGRKRPIAKVEGDIITLFEMGEGNRGFTIDRLSGDILWAAPAAFGETEYFGGCRPVPGPG